MTRRGKGPGTRGWGPEAGGQAPGSEGFGKESDDGSREVSGCSEVAGGTKGKGNGCCQGDHEVNTFEDDR